MPHGPGHPRGPALSADCPKHLLGRQPRSPGWQGPGTLSLPAHLENGASGSVRPRGLSAAGLSATETPLGSRRPGSKAQGLAGGLFWQLLLPLQSCGPGGSVPRPLSRSSGRVLRSQRTWARGTLRTGSPGGSAGCTAGLGARASGKHRVHASLGCFHSGSGGGGFPAGGCWAAKEQTAHACPPPTLNWR